MTGPKILFPVQRLIAANPCHEIPSRLGGIGPGTAGGDIAKVRGPKVAIDGAQLDVGAVGELASEINDTGQRRGGYAGATKYHPSAHALTGRAVINQDSRVGVRVKREIRRAALGSDDANNTSLIERAKLILAGSAATPAPGCLAKESPGLAIPVDGCASRGNNVRGSSRIDSFAAGIAAGGE